MNKDILNTGVQEYINKNLNTDIVSVILKKSIFPNISTQELAEQIEAKQKCSKKLPTWFNGKNIYYPNKLNIEQCSSEITAEYKSNIVEGKSLLDLTGGFGVDSYFFSQKIAHVDHCEIDQNLSQIAAYNFEHLGVKNIQTFNESGIDFLKRTNKTFDWVFIDPSRRSDTKEKIFRLADCTPNILDHLELLLKKSDNILIKTSPLLDLSLAIEQFQFVEQVHIVAIKNEVKELLWILNKSKKSGIAIHTVNLKDNNKETLVFNCTDERNATPVYGSPLTYLYEPNASILKSGTFKYVSERFNLYKLHEHTHLYTSNELIEFPGRIFKINQILDYNKKALRPLHNSKANIATRNFPKNVSEIRKQLKINDGGHLYLFFVKNNDNKNIVIKSSKIN